MARKLSIDVAADVEVIPAQYRNGTALSEIKKIAPSELRINDKNTEYFIEESEEYFTNLREDIRQRGIIVPLIAKNDGTLLAGHNRLRIAKELRLPQIPVQYVKEDLGDEREREFIIKDNLFRRHLETREWIELYRRLYPDFDATFLDDRTKVSSGRMKDGDNRLTIGQIAEETGQKYDTVKTQIRRAREEKSGTGKIHQKEKGFSEPFSQNSNNTSHQRQRQELDKQITEAVRLLSAELPHASRRVQANTVKELTAIINSLISA